MRHPTFSIIPATVFGSVVLGLAALAGDNSLPDQSVGLRAFLPFQAGVSTHEAGVASQDVLQPPNANETASEIEAVSSAPATRSTFMASWAPVSGANGYLLDISPSRS